MCSAARDPKEYMTNLLWFAEEDILETTLLEPEDDQQLASPTPEEETVLLGEPQEAEPAAAHHPRYEEWAPRPKNEAKQKEAVTEPQGM